MRGMLFTAAVSASMILLPMSVIAQESQTETGARAAVLRSLIEQSRIKDTTRVVADSAELWNRFVRCHDENGNAICAITDNKPVTMVLVKLTSPTDASVHLRDYITIRQSCPMGRPIYPPYIGFLGEQSWTVRFVDGKWAPFGRGTGMAC